MLLLLLVPGLLLGMPNSDKSAAVTEEATGLSGSSIAALACLFGFIFIVITLSLVCFLLRTRQARIRRKSTRVGFTHSTEAITDVTVTVADDTMVVDTTAATTTNDNINKSRKLGESLRKYTDWYTHRGQTTDGEPITVKTTGGEPVTVKQAEMQQHVSGNQADMNYQVFKLPTSKGIFSQKHKKPTPIMVSKHVRSPSAPPVIVSDRQGVMYTNSHYMNGRPASRIAPTPVRTFNLQKIIQPSHTQTVVYPTRTHRAPPPPQPVVHVVRTPEPTVPRPVHHKPSNPVFHVQYVPQAIQYTHNDLPDTARSSSDSYSKVHVHGSNQIQYSPRYHQPPSPGPVYEYGVSHQRASQYRPRVIESPGNCSPTYPLNNSHRRTHSWRASDSPNGEDAWISHDADSKTQSVFFDDDATNVKIQVEESYPSDVNTDVYAASYHGRESMESEEKIIDFVDPEQPHGNSVPPLRLSTPRFAEQEVTMSLDAFLGKHDSHSTSSHTSSLSDRSDQGRGRSGSDK